MSQVNAPRPINPNDATPILPTHISETIGAIAKLHADHERAATPVQHQIEKITETFGKPPFLGWFTVFVAAWVIAAESQMKLHGRSFDPPPFNLLQGVVTVLAVYMTALILSTQRRADKLASHREQLTLELATLAEQKSAKTIALLEELRRDHPMLPDRVDADAEAMSASVDPGSVLQTIIDTQEELKEAASGDAAFQKGQPSPSGLEPGALPDA